jgi:hypothetical protein
MEDNKTDNAKQAEIKVVTQAEQPKKSRWQTAVDADTKKYDNFVHNHGAAFAAGAVILGAIILIVNFLLSFVF